MARGIIGLLGSDIRCSLPDGGEQRLTLGSARALLSDWAGRYDRAVPRNDKDELIAIGQEMFAWLDRSGWATAWINGLDRRELEIRASNSISPDEALLLDAPWELLASPSAPHLALDDIQDFIPWRRIGEPGQCWTPQHRELRMLFMAAAPAGQTVLDFEAEEAEILRATRGANRVQLTVEETGELEQLRNRLAESAEPPEVLHLTCHGDIREQGPVVFLETQEGDPDPVAPGRLISSFGERLPPLVLLSACRTAEARNSSRQMAAGGATRRDAGDVARPSAPGIVLPYTRQLARRVANVVGWAGSVYDHDAIGFASNFYRDLGDGIPVPMAAARARRTLLQAHATQPAKGRHWHLARVYLGPGGGGALTAAGGRVRQVPPPSPVFLDQAREQVRVASGEAFVGRRRTLQGVLRAWKQGKAGVLVHGMGALGKSSLAARLADRLAPGHRPVVIFERYDAPTMLDRLVDALPPAERQDFNNNWRQRVEANHELLGDAVEALLAGPLLQAPILLVIDDLERTLDPPTPGEQLTRVQDDYRAALGAILRAFTVNPGRSRLLITSRYDFTLPDSAGGDLAENLARVQLPPMSETEQRKQVRARVQMLADGQDQAIRRAIARIREDGRAIDLLEQAIAAASGNPGLQDALTRPIFAAELDAATDALQKIRHFQQHGVPPEDVQALIDRGKARDSGNAIVAFFARLSFATYREALSEQQARQLQAATLFDAGAPIPVAAMIAAGRALGVTDPDGAIRRLLALGLFDDFGMMDEQRHVAANRLARPLVEALDPDTLKRLAAAVAPELIQGWRQADGGFPRDHRSVMTARLCLMGEADTGAIGTVGGAAVRTLLDAHDPREAHGLAEALVRRCVSLREAPPTALLFAAVDAADIVGEAAALDGYLDAASGVEAESFEGGSLALRQARRAMLAGRNEDAIQAAKGAARIFARSGAPRDEAIAKGQIADILHARGQLDEALRIRREEELPVFERLGDVRSKAVTMAKIADILEARGDLDEALRIRREEVLPVFERLGDVRERAITMGKIADILEARGDLDEALRIRREEELPVYERLGDVRERAITMGKIADILEARGDLDEALRIRREEELPVFERLGDVRSKAVTMGKIADILEARGDLDEALRIRREEELPVYERLGDVRERAITMGKIADILEARGDLDEALRIRREEELPVYERLGDVRSKAVTMGKIADILEARGDLDEALRIRREEELPVYERLGDVRSKAVTMGKIADILEARGDLDEALRIRREEELPVYERLGDVRSKAVTMGKIADIFQARGDLDEALRIRREEELPVYERLGDVRSKAVTMGKIADIFQARGDLDEALRIRREEQLPVYERLGDVRSKAVTMGKIADILEARGDLDEALRIRREEELPVYERLGDVRSKSVVLQQVASAMIEAGGLQQGRAQEIHDLLAEAFAIARQMRIPDGIAFVGTQLAQVLAIGGHRREALEVLAQAQAGFEALGHAEGLAAVRQLRQAIEGE